eukprot:NODE_1619_length_1439_cov_21.509909_g1536_i0.p1 GENE.NODE_1619_length_1439_cov_21.509909_g1536_i0~~NODE_1619_length_1439_cov_21.509909_g1536_i0.p1  ORF type:complete len:412 (+),score=107.92 NODE_1619_length_1439_cov_21.509909_g1536_i0:78-1238(+)
MRGRRVSTLEQRGLSEELRAIQEMARRFAEKELLPHASEWDAEKHFPVGVYRAGAELGFGGMYVREDFGSGLSRLATSVILEQLATACPATSAFFSIHNMVCGMIDVYGSEAQRHKYLPQLVSMQQLASYCLTEGGSGSDAAALRTTARREGDEYVVNGEKHFISGAGISEIYCVMVRTGESGPKGISTLIIPKDTPGVSFGRNEPKMGWNTQPTRVVTFSDVRVPVENRLGAEGIGFQIAMKGLEGGRINIASCSLGGAQQCFEQAVQYTKARFQFDQPLAHFQDIQFKLATMATQLTASRLMIRNAALALDERDPDGPLYSSMAKLAATEDCYAVVDQALQIHGGWGYMRECQIERYSRDLRVHRILEGTNEIMKMLVGRACLK